MKKVITTLSGFSSQWEDETLTALIRYERRSGSVLPVFAIKSRVLRKLCVAGVSRRPHFKATINKFIQEALADLEKSKRRKKNRNPTSYPPPVEVPHTLIEDNLTELLGYHSPLSGSERAFLQIAVDDRTSFLRKDGGVKESILGKHLGVKRALIVRRWLRIQKKSDIWRQGQLELSL